MNHRVALIGAGLLGGTGVAAGAFGAHALRGYLLRLGTLEIWQTAVHYQLAHAVALVGLAGWMRAETGERSQGRARWAAWCWIAGTALFSGSLYLLAAGAPRWVGPITPVGGAALIVGWMWLMAAAAAAAL
jgi:uncharacterized membrane protein YgdD (TMEM256/DUF423 family)